MRMFSALLIMLALPAFAAETQSEFLHQAEAGVHELTPTFVYGITGAKVSNDAGAKADLDIKARSLKLNYEYGLTEMWALGATLAHGTMSVEQGNVESEHKGFEDLELFVKGRYALGGGSLRFGGVLSLSPGDEEVDSDGNRNQYSGGHKLEPFVGYEMVSDLNIFGARFTHQVLLSDRTTDNNGTSQKSSGSEATEFELFYEYILSENGRMGLAFSHLSYAPEKLEGGLKEDTLSPLLGFMFYLPVKMGAGTLLPKLMYGITTDDRIDNTNIDDVSVKGFEIGYRLEF